MNGAICHDIYAKLTKAERCEAIEMLVKNLNSFDEVEVFFNVLDLHLTRHITDFTADNFDRSEIHDCIEDPDNVYLQNGIIKKESEVFASVNFASREDQKYRSINPDKLFPCNKCNKKFSRSDNVKRHLKSVHNSQHRKKLFSCSKCDKKFTRSDIVDNHIKRVHTGDLKKPFICDICNKQWGSKSDLERHRAIHSGLKPYSCPICRKSFSLSQHLKSHFKIHKSKPKNNSGKKLYNCAVCDKQFSIFAYLKVHSKIHTRQTAISCQHCDKKFKNQASYKFHLKWFHLSEKKLFPCEKCDKQLTSKWNYEYHIKRYHDDVKEKELFSCKKCDKKFIYKTRYIAHNKRVHEDNN